MNGLDYSISLREKGLTSNQIKDKMRAKGFEESQIQFYLKKSDEIHLDNLIQNRKPKSAKKIKNGLKMAALLFSFFLLYLVFFGYATIGLLGLFFIWSIIGYGSYRK